MTNPPLSPATPALLQLCQGEQRHWGFSCLLAQVRRGLPLPCLSFSINQMGIRRPERCLAESLQTTAQLRAWPSIWL